MVLTSFDHVLWLAGSLGHLFLLFVLIRKRRVSNFPFFSALIFFNIARSLSLLAVRRYEPLAYFYLYWSLSFVDTLLQIAVFTEITLKVFRPTGFLSRDTRRPLLLLVIVSSCVAIFLAGLAHPPAPMLDQRLVLRGQLFSTMLMAEVFAGLTLISATAGFVWRSQTGTIARGLGMYSVCSLLIQGVQNFVGLPNGSEAFVLLAHLQICCYLLCLGYWIVGLMREAPVTRPLPEGLKVQLARLNSYMAAALMHVRSAGASS